MHKSTLAGLLAIAAGSLSATTSLAQDQADPAMPPAAHDAAAATPSTTCLDHIKTFNTQLEKDGHWLGGSGYGYGFPASGYWLGGAGFIFPPMSNYGDGVHVNARLGYEVRTLLAAARISARSDKAQLCETTLSAAEDTYKVYLADLKSRDIPTIDKGWREAQIAAAKPVSEQATPMRSDELLGTELRNGKNETLGSVDDLVLDPSTGKIAYLVIQRGELFGIGGEFVPIPWSHFKITPKLDLLVLDASTRTMDAAPHVNHRFFMPETSTSEDQKADLYWKAHLVEND